jgi:L,D-transpeptidase ErfK/SrfK
MQRNPGIRSSVIVLAAALAGFAANVAGGAEYALPPDHDVIGEVRRIKARYEDTFVKLAREHGVGYEELRLANPGVDAWLPGEGTEIVLPTRYVLPQAQRTGIVINVPELRLYYFPPDEPDKVITHPISIGRMDWQTPLGQTRVVAKAADPSWYPPQSIREEHAARNDPLPAVVPPGPDNPLGKHALRLGIPGYLIHGTNKPSGVGMRVTHGCIRMFPEDIEALFTDVPTGTRVNIVNQPYKLGWSENGALFLEVHPPLEEESERGDWTATQLTRAFVAATSGRHADFSWDAAESVMRDARGVPVAVAIGPAIEGLKDDTLEAEVIEVEHIDAEVGEADSDAGAAAVL